MNMQRRWQLIVCLFLPNLLVAVEPEQDQQRPTGLHQTSGEMQSAVETIDSILKASWDRDGVEPASQSSDAEFCRRVWLDLAGVAPPVATIRKFMVDFRADKRARLIDHLLRSPQYANHMASRWNEILLPPDAQNQLQQQANVTALHEWLRGQFRDNTPYDYFVGGFLTAGGAGDSGPAIFYTSHLLEPEKLAAATSRIFMGIQLQCAQCHDHPFDRWTQEDFWHYAAFFSQLEQGEAADSRSAMIEDRVGGEVTLPDSDTIMVPRYPGVAEPPEEDPSDIRRRQLTIWMASRDNPYFARAAVNRAWSHLFGCGIVDPVDAMDADNLPSHPELLDFLTRYFIEIRFDLRKLYATLARSRAYGLTSEIVGNERPDASHFAAMSVKTLSAEQFFDSLQQNVYRRSQPSAGNRSGDFVARQQFLSRMRSAGASPQSYPHGVVQALGMMNGPEMMSATNPEQIGLLASLEAPFFCDKDRVETLFLSTLSRLPTEDELKTCLDMFSVGGRVESDGESDDSSSSFQSQQATADLLWVLLNTAECATCP